MAETSTIAIKRSPFPLTGALLMASITLFWGLNWPGMKLALNEIPVWWFRSISLGCGAVILLSINYLFTRTLFIKRKEILPLVLISVFSIVGWHTFTAFGVSLMPAGRASIIAFTMPVWATILSAFILREPITVYKILGLLLGMAGLGVLIGSELTALETAPIGALAMLGASVSWALGTVLFKSRQWHSSLALLTGWQLVIGSSPITLIAIMTKPFPDLSNLSIEASWAMVYLISIPIVYCQWAFLNVVKMFPASIAAMGMLAVPIVGVFSSALILNEVVGYKEVIALLLICSALFCVLILPNLRK